MIVFFWFYMSCVKCFMVNHKSQITNHKSQITNHRASGITRTLILLRLTRQRQFMTAAMQVQLDASMHCSASRCGKYAAAPRLINQNNALHDFLINFKKTHFGSIR